ncbi:unnamed protein product [Symbiodinium natans]|uniref:Prolyl 4-hydroxylase alpha subunit domain-containing protein n=1 Tax=Symbiodinium natans TaxID=878477 RepID=A0A812KB20_9DINO|nr:unnamed protein product [Symbiodinium natans]
MVNPETFERAEAYRADMLSLNPKVLRIRNMLTHKECALLRWLMLEAVIYFGDSSEFVFTRPGALNASSGFGRLGKRPLLRMQDTDQLSFYFPEPPDFLVAMMERVAQTFGVHPNNVEAIYHLYLPSAMPANLHLDNFNKYLWPHRFQSVSLFLDDYEDGGTVFPLLLDTFGRAGKVSHMGVAAEHDEVLAWQQALNDSRNQRVTSDTEAYVHRRVDSNEPSEFRQRVLEAARDMCRHGRAAQAPVLPERGTLYLWFNYLENGEDDVRTIHAGCSSSKEYKMIGTMFLRDGSGPFREHDSFWDFSVGRAHEAEEIRRRLEMVAVARFRFDHIAALFNLERQSVFELHGGAEAVRLAAFHTDYTGFLIERGDDRGIHSLLSGMVQKYGFKGELKWSLTSHDGLMF